MINAAVAQLMSCANRFKFIQDNCGKLESEPEGHFLLSLKDTLEHKNIPGKNSRGTDCTAKCMECKFRDGNNKVNPAATFFFRQCSLFRTFPDACIVCKACHNHHRTRNQ